MEVGEDISSMGEIHSQIKKIANNLYSETKSSPKSTKKADDFKFESLVKLEFAINLLSALKEVHGSESVVGLFCDNLSARYKGQLKKDDLQHLTTTSSLEKPETKEKSGPQVYDF